jgi:hypothetical protein
MADSHAKMTQATPQEVIISIVAGLLAPLLAIFLVIQLVLSIQEEHKPTPPATPPRKRRSPASSRSPIWSRSTPTPRAWRISQEVYDAVYLVPRVRRWALPFEQGRLGGRIASYNTLIKHATEASTRCPRAAATPICRTSSGPRGGLMAARPAPSSRHRNRARRRQRQHPLQLHPPAPAATDARNSPRRAQAPRPQAPQFAENTMKPFFRS